MLDKLAKKILAYCDIEYLSEMPIEEHVENICHSLEKADDKFISALKNINSLQDFLDIEIPEDEALEYYFEEARESIDNNLNYLSEKIIVNCSLDFLSEQSKDFHISTLKEALSSLSEDYFQALLQADTQDKLLEIEMPQNNILEIYLTDMKNCIACHLYK